jgi:hypothetical protein
VRLAPRNCNGLRLYQSWLERNPQRQIGCQAKHKYGDLVVSQVFEIQDRELRFIDPHHVGVDIRDHLAEYLEANKRHQHDYNVDQCAPSKKHRQLIYGHEFLQALSLHVLGKNGTMLVGI